jgi:hypothetical protein
MDFGIGGARIEVNEDIEIETFMCAPVNEADRSICTRSPGRSAFGRSVCGRTRFHLLRGWSSKGPLHTGERDGDTLFAEAVMYHLSAAAVLHTLSHNCCHVGCDFGRDDSVGRFSLPVNSSLFARCT